MVDEKLPVNMDSIISMHTKNGQRLYSKNTSGSGGR